MFDRVGPDDPASHRLLYYRGRVGLTAILRCLGIGVGDEVITQAFTCVAVPEGIMAVGATPVYGDVLSDGVTIDPASVEQRLTDRTRAVIVQHTFGIPAEIDRIMSLAGARGIPVIEDCAHTVLSRYGGLLAGSFGAAAFYSFEWGKPIVAGVGGSVVCNDPRLADQLDRDYVGLARPALWREIRLQAQYVAFRIVYRPELFWAVRAVYRGLAGAGLAEGNYHAAVEQNGAPDFSLRMGSWAAERVNRGFRIHALDLGRRRDLAERYRTALAPVFTLPPVPTRAEPVYARFPVLIDEREELLRRAQDCRVELAVWYESPVHPLVGRDLSRVAYTAGSCPNAESVAGRIVSLPMHPRVTSHTVERALDLMRGFGAAR